MPVLGAGVRVEPMTVTHADAVLAIYQAGIEFFTVPAPMSEQLAVSGACDLWSRASTIQRLPKCRQCASGHRTGCAARCAFLTSGSARVRLPEGELVCIAQAQIARPDGRTSRVERRMARVR
jgi:hypothetical protein